MIYLYKFKNLKDKDMKNSEKLNKINKNIEKIEKSKHSILLYETYYEWKLKKLEQQKANLEQQDMKIQ